MNPIAYYITAHGYGHGARSCDILRQIHRRAPRQPIWITTDLPHEFLRSRLRDCDNLIYRRGASDVGLVQSDSIRADLAQTLDALGELDARWDALLAREQLFLKSENVGLVVADIPAIPLAAAQLNGVSNVAIGNFSWDWIYAEYAREDRRWNHFVNKFRAVYERTDLLLRLPFSPAMSPFPHQKTIPLLASPGTPRRDKLAALAGLDGDKPWILLSFTSLALPPHALDRIDALSRDYEFLCVEPLRYERSSIRSINREMVSFSDVLASCDAVISKPGFGLVSECIVNHKPLIYSDRGDFAEYPYLVRGIRRYLKNHFLPSQQLYAGDFKAALRAIERADHPAEHLAKNGAELVVQELLKRIR